MLKNKFKYQIFASIFLLLAITFAFYWEMWIGKWFFIVMPILILNYLILIFVFFYQLIKSIQNKFQEKSRNIQIIVLVFVLTIVTIKPFGVINFDKFYGNDVLVSNSEGVAGCGGTFKIKDKNWFIYRSVCFSIEKYMGKYEIKNDTIFFLEKNRKFKYNYAIIKGKNIMLISNEFYVKPKTFEVTSNKIK
ncbi:hypothetical protein [Moheibacter lacus]|uniref:Uncharacterized protein n=1 Tax=Moheibacter lacus TaxID=2745851 RepID=A0A838ZPJ4_9FLAO|nr:hypothetical protein [Moheibacter lacus]MBA5629387.1 hypothetical protein [Moheibacter lacus]